MINQKLLRLYSGTFIVLFVIIGGMSLTPGSEMKGIFVSTQDEYKAGQILDEGNKYFEEEEYDKAIEIWMNVYNDYIGTSSWGKAAWNIGLAYSRLEQYETAIDYYLAILESDVNDFEPGASVMEAYRNYRHKAASSISHCYEMLEDYDLAIEYATLARDKYPYESWCGTCGMSVWNSQKRLINRLTLFKEWSVKKERICEFELTYNISVDTAIEYNVHLPTPLAIDNSTFFFMNISKVIEGNPIYEIIESMWGTALNISCIGPCSIQMKYMISATETYNESKIFHRFSLQNEENPYQFWTFSSYGGETWRDNLKLSLNGQWIKYPPDWEYVQWDEREYSMSKGWDEARIFDDDW